MRSECCEEVEQRLGLCYEDTEVGCNGCEDLISE